MPNTTRGYPYPVLVGGGADVPADMQAALEAVDTDVGAVEAAAAAALVGHDDLETGVHGIPAMSAGQGLVWDGASWVATDIATAAEMAAALADHADNEGLGSHLPAAGATHAHIAAANKDGAAATASMRTLGTGAAQAMAGNDARVSGPPAVYRHVARAVGLFSGHAAATYFLTPDGAAPDASPIGYPPLFSVALADYAITGMDTVFRVRIWAAVNNVSPVTNFNGECWVMDVVDGAASAENTYTPSGTSITGAAVGPASGADASDPGTDTTLSGTSKLLALACRLDAAQAATSRAHVMVDLQVRNVPS